MHNKYALRESFLGSHGQIIGRYAAVEEGPFVISNVVQQIDCQLRGRKPSFHAIDIDSMI